MTTLGSGMIVWLRARRKFSRALLVSAANLTFSFDFDLFTMASLRPQLLRLASRRLSAVRSISTRSFLSMAADRGSVASSRWTALDEPPRYSLSLSSSSVRSFSTTTDEEKKDDKKTDDNGKQEDTTPAPTKEEVKDMHKESLQFQAETRQLLDIVTHSLYTDKEGTLLIL